MSQDNNQISKLDLGSLCQVGLENFNSEVLDENRPILILCMSKGRSFVNQINEFEKVRVDFLQDLKMCLLEEDFLGVFMERFNVRGTPTFLIFCDGSERARLLGRATNEDLNRFVIRVLSDLNSSTF